MNKIYSKLYFCRLRRSIAFAIIVFAYFINSASAATPTELINQMVRDGFNATRADLLCGQWSDTKQLLINLANSGDRAQIELAHKIVSHRFSSWEQTWTSVVDDMVNEGFRRPVDAMAPTGGWKKPLALQGSSEVDDMIKFVVDGANADIDATFFGSNPAVAEEFVERTTIKWATKTSGPSALLPDGTPNYTKLNDILRNSEITPFPRHPDGSMSEAFKRNFPEIVHEGYPGAYGQRSLEIDYLLTDKGKADIVRYDRNGNLIKMKPDPKNPAKLIRAADGDIQLSRNHAAANVIEDLTNARYTRLDRIQRLVDDYWLKYKGHLGAGATKDAETTAKMLQRMIEGDSHLRGVKAMDHPLYRKAARIKDALREGDDVVLKTWLGEQSLDDFVKNAQREMDIIHSRNERRLAGMLDDSIGTSTSRLNTAMRGLVAVGYGVVGLDAWLKAKEGEGSKEIAKALASALAADLAAATAAPFGTAVGAKIATKTLGDAATLGGLSSGLLAAMVAGIVVHKTIEWTEEGINKIVSGYKEGATLQKIFLDPAHVKDFLKMSPEQIKEIIEREWDAQHQWGGAFVGKFGDKEAQERLKQNVFEQAMAIQNSMNHDQLRAQLSAEIVTEELARIADMLDRGEITEEKAEELRKNMGDIVNQKLGDRYGSLLDKLTAPPPGKPGLFGTMFGPSEEEGKKIRNNADAGFGDFVRDQGYLEGRLGDFDTKAQELIETLRTGGDAAELFKQLVNIYGDVMDIWASMESSSLVILNDISNSYGTDEDLTIFHQRKGLIAAILASLRPKVMDKREMMARLRQLMQGLEGTREASFIQELEDYLQRLVANCGLRNEQEEIAHDGLNKARDASDRLTKNSIEIVEIIDLLEKGTISNCENADQLKAEAIKSAQNADQWGKRAKQGFDGAMIFVRSCSNAKSIEEADKLFNAAQALGDRALSRYKDAQQTLDQLSSDIKDANDQLDYIDRLMSNIEIDRKTFGNHSKSFDTIIRGIERLEGVCKFSENNINERLAEILKENPSLDDHSKIVAIRKQIGTVANDIDMTSVTKEMAAARRVANTGLKQYEKQKNKPSSMRKQLESCKIGDRDPLTIALRDAGWTLMELKDYEQWDDTFKNTRKECVAALGIDEEGDQGEVDKLYVVFRVQGSGFTPHWAGASYKMSGHDQVLVIINRSSETPEQRRVAYRNFLMGDICEMKNPPGFVWKRGRPMIWDAGPMVTTVAVEEEWEDIDEALLVDAWKFDGDDPRSLFKLRKEQGCD
ncbi:MAG: hypothetical protein GY774_20345 [Planctomycetes bacterium]|nr:hypothetical protein [Planctomycetota bacterium]